MYCDFTDVVLRPTALYRGQLHALVTKLFMPGNAAQPYMPV